MKQTYSNTLRRSSPRSLRSRMHLLASAISAAVAVACASGCRLVNVPKLVESMGRDTNSVQVLVVSPWGQVQVQRNAGPPKLP